MICSLLTASQVAKQPITLLPVSQGFAPKGGIMRLPIILFPSLFPTSGTLSNKKTPRGLFAAKVYVAQLMSAAINTWFFFMYQHEDKTIELYVVF